MTPVIRIKELTKSYGAFTALDRLTLDIAKGEIFGFLGHNGAGKTTTIHILTSLLRPTTGSADIMGADVVTGSMVSRGHIGYVPENVRLYEPLTARENLIFFGELSGVQEAGSRALEVLELLECPDLERKKIFEMSKGQRQRIGLAQAILHKPSVLFLDEPTSGLDPLGIRQLRNLITKLNQQQDMTIFMNTHLISEVSKTCTSIGVLNRGKLVYQAGIDEVMMRFGNDLALEDFYLSVVPGKAA